MLNCFYFNAFFNFYKYVGKISDHLFLLLIGWYSNVEIRYCIKKNNDKNTNFVMENNKKMPRKYVKE